MPKPIRIHFIGFGRVAKALVNLAAARPIVNQHGREIRLEAVGVATASHGSWALPRGLAVPELSRRTKEASHLEGPLPGERVRGAYELLRSVPADLMVETSPLNPFGGEPAVSHVRQALQQGMHVVTANKGPAACAYRELRALAEQRKRAFLFEATVLGGTPVFRLVRAALPGARLLGVRGLLNSTSSYLLARMEAGLTFEQALQEAQARGIAESDPEQDIEGLDAATKLAVLVNVLLEGDLRPAEVARRGISHITPQKVRDARAKGEQIRLVAWARRQDGGLISGVGPERLAPSDPLVCAGERPNVLILETDVLGSIGVFQPEPGLDRTAYGLYADLVEVAWRVGRSRAGRAS